MVKNPNWQEANQLAIYNYAWSSIWTRDYREQIQLAVRAGLELGASELQVPRALTARSRCLLLHVPKQETCSRWFILDTRNVLLWGNEQTHDYLYYLTDFYRVFAPLRNHVTQNP